MEKKTRKILLEYLITFIIGAAVTAGVLLSRGTFGKSERTEIFKDLCDAFTVPGLLLILFAALVFVSNGGAFNGLTFAVGKVICVFRSAEHRVRESYAEYCARKREKNLHGYAFLFFTGLFFFAAALLFLALYYGVQ